MNHFSQRDRELFRVSERHFKVGVRFKIRNRAAVLLRWEFFRISVREGLQLVGFRNRPMDIHVRGFHLLAITQRGVIEVDGTRPCLCQLSKEANGDGVNLQGLLRAFFRLDHFRESKRVIRLGRRRSIMLIRYRCPILASGNDHEGRLQRFLCVIVFVSQGCVERSFSRS